MGLIRRNFEPDPIVETGSTAEFSSGDGLLTFQYCVAEPGVCARGVTTRHCMVIPQQPDPIRAAISRDGDQRRFTMRPGDIALAPASTDVVWQWYDPARVVLIWIDPDVFQTFIEQDMRLILGGNSLDGEIIVHDPELASAAAQMLSAVSEDGLGTQVLFESLARIFLVILVRHYGQPVETEHTTHGLTLTQYTRLVDHIEARLDQKLSPADLAGALGLSETVFARRFKAHLGKTPMQFVTECRIKAATDLVTRTDLTFGQIALRCGFADQAHLSRTFKKAHGQTPRAFRKSHIPA